MAPLSQVVRRGCADHDAERPERHRDDRPDAGAQTRVDGRDGREQQDRDQPADEMVARGGAGLGLHEVVVEHVRRDYGDADHDDRAFAAGRAGRGGRNAAGAARASGPRAAVVVPVRTDRVSAIASPHHGRGAWP